MRKTIVQQIVYKHIGQRNKNYKYKGDTYSYIGENYENNSRSHTGERRRSTGSKNNSNAGSGICPQIIGWEESSLNINGEQRGRK